MAAPTRRHPAPGSTASLRAANQRRVLAVLQSGDGSQVSQAEIARTTQLAPATVSNIVRDLAGAGLVDTVTGSGRRGTAVTISRRAGLVVGVDFGHRHVRVAVGDLAGSVLAESAEPLSPDHPHQEGLDSVERQLGDLLTSIDGDRAEVATLGIGLPAPVNDDGVVMSSGILPGWVGVRAGDVAEQRFAAPAFVENDANLGALAEYRLGAGAGHDTMVFVKVASGLGAGLIVDGELFRGAAGTAGEIGHLTFDEQGPVCRCGSRGCLEAYTSVGMTESMLAEQFPDASFGELVRAALEGNVAALRTFEDAGLHLGWGLAMLANLLNPSTIVVGGEMVRAGDMLLDSVRVGLRRHALPSVASHTSVTAAHLGDRASVMGALLMAIDRTELIPAHGVG
ncbi:MAG TPA: ROK family transcriptional regulator [Nocardioidaceae bacterium]|nr:ROK family transcriptional regulator [Nocardioidaceae bacterium]